MTHLAVIYDTVSWLIDAICHVYSLIVIH